MADDKPKFKGMWSGEVELIVMILNVAVPIGSAVLLRAVQYGIEKGSETARKVDQLNKEEEFTKLNIQAGGRAGDKYIETVSRRMVDMARRVTMRRISFGRALVASLIAVAPSALYLLAFFLFTDRQLTRLHENVLIIANLLAASGAAFVAIRGDLVEDEVSGGVSKNIFILCLGLLWVFNLVFLIVHATWPNYGFALWDNFAAVTDPLLMGGRRQTEPLPAPPRLPGYEMPRYNDDEATGLPPAWSDCEPKDARVNFPVETPAMHELLATDHDREAYDEFHEDRMMRVALGRSWPGPTSA